MSSIGCQGNAGQSNYSASKSGIIGFTKSIAQELGSRNIRCNAMAQVFETEMTGALGEDVVNTWIQTFLLRELESRKMWQIVACFLASDMGAYVSGQVISVCGGMLT